eukprot:tig00020996_g16948.t1
MLREASEIVGAIYWFEDGPEDRVLELWATCTLLMYQAKAGLPLEALLDRTAAVLGRLPPEHPDTDILQAVIPVATAFIHIKSAVRGQVSGSYLKAVLAYRKAMVLLSQAPWTYMCDFVTSFAVNFSGSEPASLARGVRIAAGLQRLFDWTDSTPVLAHFLALLGRLYMRCGDPASAQRAFHEALAVRSRVYR